MNEEAIIRELAQIRAGQIATIELLTLLYKAVTKSQLEGESLEIGDQAKDMALAIGQKYEDALRQEFGLPSILDPEQSRAFEFDWSEVIDDPKGDNDK